MLNMVRNINICAYIMGKMGKDLRIGLKSGSHKRGYQTDNDYNDTKNRNNPASWLPKK